MGQAPGGKRILRYDSYLGVQRIKKLARQVQAENPPTPETPESPVKNTAYAANYNNGSTTAIDTNTNLVAVNFGSTPNPRANEINPVTGVLATGAYTGASVTLTDATDPLYPTIATVAVGGQPRIIETRPDGLEMWVVNNASNSISVIDSDPNSPTYNTVITTITGINSNPRGLKFDPTGTFALVTTIAGGNIYKIDVATKTVTLLTTLGDSPHGIEISDDGTKFYASGFSSGTLYIRDTATGAFIADIPMGSPHGMARKNGKIYVGNYFPNTVTVIDQNNDTVITAIAGFPRPYSLDEDPDPLHDQVYVTSDSTAAVYVIDTVFDTLVRTIPIQTRSRHITVA